MGPIASLTQFLAVHFLCSASRREGHGPTPDEDFEALTKPETYWVDKDELLADRIASTTSSSMNTSRTVLQADMEAPFRRR